MILEKHKKYINKYKPNILYWGLGIENELYLEFDKKKLINKNQFLNCHKRERYSVDYYTNYKVDIIKKAFNYINDNMSIKYDSYNNLPLLMNSFSFTKTDMKNNSKTKYTKLCEPNPLFNGKLLTDTIFLHNNNLYNMYDNNFVYDGDVIEFITTEFFNTTLNSIIFELLCIKKDYIQNLRKVFSDNNIFTEYGTINYMTQNHPFGIYLTNINNVSMFNNGTLHFNITLPTNLDKNGLIACRDTFTYQHMNYIRFIQFMEPLIISIYGAPDPFSYIKNINNESLISDEMFRFSLLFSSSSQRCAISRYIGIGTYDTDKMDTGKLVTIKSEETVVCKEPYGWYNEYHMNSAYNKLKEVGYDINFNKHLNHGVEIRFLDHITCSDKMKEVFKFLIYLGDFSLYSNTIENPIYNKIWNKLVVETMKYGVNTNIDNITLNMFNTIFNHIFKKTNIKDLYYEIFDFLKDKSSTNNIFSSKALKNILYWEL